MTPAPRLGIVVMVALLASAVTWALGWWAVVPVAVVVGWFLRHVPGTAAWTGAGAALGWALLLVIDALGGALARVASALGGTLHLPVVALLVVTLAIPALLAWSSAAVGATLGALLADSHDRAPLPSTDRGV